MKRTLIPFALVVALLMSNTLHAQWTQIGLSGSKVLCMTSTGTNLFAGTDGQGVYLSTDNGASWTTVNTGLTNARVFALAVSGVNLFAGTDGGGAFLSTNNGTSWTAVNTGLPRVEIYAFAVSGTNLFAGTLGGGVFLSTNNGTSWTALCSYLDPNYIWSVAVSGTNLLVGAQDGVYLTTNNGTSWTAGTGLPRASAFALAVSGTNLFAGTERQGVYLSSNSGTSWTAVNTGFGTPSVMALVVSGTNVFAGTSLGGVFLSTNNGASWAAVNSGLTNPMISSLAVSGTNLLAGTQGGVWRRPLSEMITPSTSTITVTSPNGGENWQVGSNRIITWTCSNITNVKIEYTTDNGSTWSTISNSSSASSGSYSWSVPNTPSTQCKVRVSDAASPTSVTDQSNNVFTISGGSSASVTVTSPNGGESWQVAAVKNITWRSASVSNVKIEYTTNNGSTWSVISSSYAASGVSYAWTVPNTPSTQCKVRVTDVSNPLLADMSDNSFSIIAGGTLTVVSPNGGENWQMGSSHNITWTSSNVSNVMIEYSTNNGSSWNGIVTSYPASGGSYSWTVPNAPSTQCKVRVSDAASPTSVTDQSDIVFTISAASGGTGLIAYYPFNGNANDESGNGRNGVNYGATLTTDRFGQASKAYSFNGISNFIDIPGTSTLHLASGFTLCAWVNFTDASSYHAIVGKHVAGYGDGYYLMIRPETKPEFFTSSEPGLQSPDAINDGKWHFLVGTYDGSTMRLYVDNVLKLTQPKTYSSTNDSTISIGRHHAIPNWFSGKIDDVSIYGRALTATEISTLFGASSASVTVTSPNGGENWQVGSSHNITWTSSGVSNVMVEYSTNNGSSWNGIATSYPASGGSYSWTVPNASSTQCKVRVSDAANSTAVQDVSDNSFTISSGGSGMGWIAVNTGLTRTNIYALALSPASGGTSTNLFAATENGGIFLSTDNGTSWTAANSGIKSTAVVNSFAFIGTNIFAGSSSGVYLSTNNGTSWTPANTGLTDTNVWSLAASGTNVYAGTSSSLFLSTNNGTSWTAISARLTNSGIYALAMSGSSSFAGAYEGVFRSTDNGTTWIAANNGLDNKTIRAFVFSGTSIFVGTYGGGVCLSTNNGTSWNYASSGITDFTIWALAMTGTNLFASTYYAGVFLSPNNGTSWTAVNAGLTNLNVHNLALSPAAGGSGSAYLFAGTLGAGVWRRPLSEMITSAERLLTDLPTHFSLSQNYPNPFNPSTVISFDVPVRSYVSLKIFDMIGREVSSLVSEELSMGKYSRRWNAAGLPSGVYCYRLQARPISGGQIGSLTETKKLILLR